VRICGRKKPPFSKRAKTAPTPAYPPPHGAMGDPSALIRKKAQSEAIAMPRRNGSPPHRFCFAKTKKSQNPIITTHCEQAVSDNCVRVLPAREPQCGAALTGPPRKKSACCQSAPAVPFFHGRRAARRLVSNGQNGACFPRCGGVGGAAAAGVAGWCCFWNGNFESRREGPPAGWRYGAVDNQRCCNSAVFINTQTNLGR
jgi:hypothetical protein